MQSLEPTLAPLDRRFQAPSPRQQAQESHDFTFGVLVRAGELARITDAEVVEKNGSL
jgi:hypothetical protein